MVEPQAFLNARRKLGDVAANPPGWRPETLRRGEVDRTYSADPKDPGGAFHCPVLKIHAGHQYTLTGSFWDFCRPRRLQTDQECGARVPGIGRS